MSSRTTKQKNRELQKKIEEEKYRLENPDECFCDEPEYDETTFFKLTDPIDGFPYWNSKGFQQSIYICKKCGKYYEQKICY